jgi:hypothetical protein
MTAEREQDKLQRFAHDLGNRTDVVILPIWRPSPCSNYPHTTPWE